MLNQTRRSSLLMVGVLILFNILAWTAVYDLNQPDFLEVNFFNIGQGDSIFIETPGGYQILIDGGPSSKILEKLGQEMPFWDRTIDLMILTHPDLDHLTGLIDVLKNYKVNLVATNGTVSSRPEFKEFKNQIISKKIQSVILKKSQKILIGKNIYFGGAAAKSSSAYFGGAAAESNLPASEVYFEILAPLEDFEGREASDFNTSSIVARMVFLGNEFLFTGDTSKSIEDQLVEEGIDLDSDVLKVSHHGSKTATSESFINAVRPEIAVIQVGLDNQYGHPNQEVLDLLNKYGIKIFRTDKDGDIKIISNGKSYEISTLQNQS